MIEMTIFACIKFWTVSKDTSTPHVMAISSCRYRQFPHHVRLSLSWTFARFMRIESGIGHACWALWGSGWGVGGFALSCHFGPWCLFACPMMLHNPGRCTYQSSKNLWKIVHSEWNSIRDLWILISWRTSINMTMVWSESFYKKEILKSADGLA